MASLCKPETIPTDFANVLQIYTKQGLRVIAAATKSLNANARWREVDEMSRSELEEKCEFLGLIVMQNLVKKETYPAIEKLHGADIESVMVYNLIFFSFFFHFGRTVWIDMVLVFHLFFEN